MKKRCAFKSRLAWTATALLLGLTGCLPELPEPPSGAQVSPLATAVSPSQISPLATATRPSPVPTDDDIAPTPAPTSTPPPLPTLLPTPVVTPIPTAAPPIIPEVVGKAQQPFWIIYWKGNEIWRIDDQGKDRQLLLDTYKSLGQWLTGHPMAGSDCCWDSVRVVASPNGQKLAIVTVDKIKLAYKGEPFAFSIHVFDIQTGDLRFLSKGASPVWSPDGKHIAFIRLTSDGQVPDGGLWIADLEVNNIYPLIKGNPANPALHVSYWTWSPDSQRIAYRYSEGIVEKPEIWVKSVAESSLPYLVLDTSEGFYAFRFIWMPDGQNLLCDNEDQVAPEHPINLWTISVRSGERKQLTRDLFASLGQWSPDGKWLVFSAIGLYERKKQPYDIWLLNADDMELKRVTAAPPQSISAYWTPDGTRLVFQREGVGWVVMSLQTGEMASLGTNLLDMASNNYAIGGAK
jgi:Tol biopolymer transport system component